VDRASGSGLCVSEGKVNVLEDDSGSRPGGAE
jgi:hypothetical protein